MAEPDRWVILMTEAAAEPGQAEVGVYGRGGGVARSLVAARVFGSRADAEAQVCEMRRSGRSCNGYVLTVAPLDSPAIPPLPGAVEAAGQDRA
jgi:hypothetical protein